MKINFKENNKIKDLKMRMEYREWKFNALDEAAYFIIFQGFIEQGLLLKISGNALKLYIYLGINSNNFEGVVWHSTEKLAKYFGKSQRTIRGWMKELEDVGLIKRMRLKYDGEVYTYLRPYKIKVEKQNTAIEGSILIDKNNSLVFKFKVGEREQIEYISSGTELEIYDYSTGRWIGGRIVISRNMDDYNFTYVFKPKMNAWEKKIALDPEVILKVRRKINNI